MSGLTWLSQGEHGAEDFSLAGGQREITGALWLPEAFDTHTPLVLLGHGASGDRYQTPIPHLARRFVQEAGYAALALDGPVHGRRQGGAGGREAFAAEMQRPEFIDDMVQDWRSALMAVVDDKGMGVDHLGYFGLSMGTIFGVPLLASDLTFTASVIGLCGTYGLGKPIGQRLAADAQRIEHPVLFLMQLEDELFSRDGCLALFDALGAKDKRMHANPGLHPEVPAEEIGCSYDFLKAQLDGNAERRIVNPLAQ